MPLNTLKPYLGDIDALLSITEEDAKKSYAQPALKNLGSVTFVVLRELISPASFRNAESEITDIESRGRRHVRAVANKFKFGERARGLQVLRFFAAFPHKTRPPFTARKSRPTSSTSMPWCSVTVPMRATRCCR